MTFKTLTPKENTMNAKWIVVAAIGVTSVVLGIVAAWDLALAVLLLAAFVFGIRYIADGTPRGYEGFYGGFYGGGDGGGAGFGGFGDGGFGGGFGDGGFGGGGDGGGGGA